MASWNDLPSDIVGLIMSMRGEMCAWDSFHRGYYHEDLTPWERATDSDTFWMDLPDTFQMDQATLMLQETEDKWRRNL